jgi:hypothetical protein
MATRVYDSGYVNLVDGTEVYVRPLKIKYLREFMTAFDLLKISKNDEDSINILSYCALVALKIPVSRYTNNVEEFEDQVDLPNVYKILDIAAGIKINEKSEDTVKKQAEDSKSSTWDDLDLAELEAELFLAGHLERL